VSVSPPSMISDIIRDRGRARSNKYKNLRVLPVPWHDVLLPLGPSLRPRIQRSDTRKSGADSQGIQTSPPPIALTPDTDCVNTKCGMEDEEDKGADGDDRHVALELQVELSPALVLSQGKSIPWQARCLWSSTSPRAPGGHNRLSSKENESFTDF
jgi:hypothetical protein